MIRAEDAELVRQSLAGERCAFAGLVERYRNVVCGAAYHYLGNFEDAQDAAQEALVHAYLHLAELRDPARFAPWLRRITANVCADFLRRRGEAVLSLDAEEQAGTLPPAARPIDDPDRVATRLAVRDALNGLSDRVRLTVTLFYMSGYSHAEIARFLEIPINTVRSRLQLGKRHLREEMLAMVTDVLNEGKPDPQFTRRVVEEAMRRGEEAMQAHAAGDAIRHYDEALAALEKLEPDAEQQRLKMEALWKKCLATKIPRGDEEAIKLYEQSLAIAEELGDRQSQAQKLVHLGASLRRGEKAEECYQKALQLYRELGEARGEGECLLWLGSQRMFAGDAARGRSYYEQALPLFEATGSHEWAAVCRAMLDVLAEVGEERFPTLISWAAICDGLEQQAGAVRFACQPGSSLTRNSPEVPAAFCLTSVFWQVSRLRKFLDASVPVGGSWSGDAFSYSYQPLRSTVSVKSATERVAVPAGTFENCLLTEQVTTESDLPDDAPEQRRELNRIVFCGTRRAWYAPGVGLVQLHVQTGEGKEALIQLKEFAVQSASGDYLPLEIGNAWDYGWANVPAEYAAKEAYRATACEGDVWYLEHYGYAYREPDCQP